MKKIISLILSIALLATLMPTTLFVSAADTAETVTVDITESTTIDASYKSSNGEVTFGGTAYGINDNYVYIGSPSATHVDYWRAMLLKAPLASVAEKLTAGKVVTKVELQMTSVKSGGHNSSKSGTFRFYNSSTSWEASSTKLEDWFADTGDANLYPKVKVNHTGNLAGDVSVQATPDVEINTTVPAVSDTTNGPITLDVTNVYKAAFPTDNVVSSSNISLFGEWYIASTYHLIGIASCTNSNTELRPKLVFTIDTIPTFTEVSHSDPEMLTDEFSLTMSNAIDAESAEITVNGTKLENAQYTINNATLTLNCEYIGLSENTVTVKLTDTYNQTFEETYTFTPRDANGADASGVIKKYITIDAAIKGSSQTTNSSTDETVLLRAVTNATASLLYKTSFADLTIPSDKKITKVQLHLGVVEGDNRTTEMTANVYHVTGEWDVATVTPASFIGESATLSPKLEWPGSNNVNGWPVGTPDATGRIYTPTKPTGNTIVPAVIDITPVFQKQFTTGEITGNGEMSFLISSNNVGYDHYNTIAMSEYPDKAARPYLTITLDDKSKENITATEFYHYSITNPSAAALSGDSWVYRTNDKTTTSYESNSVVLMRFDLTENYYDSFNVTYTAPYELSHQTIYKFDNDANSAGTSLTYNDLDPVVYNEDNLIGYVSAVGDTTVAAIDVADYANECVANGKDYMCLIIATDGNSCKVSSATPTAATVKPLETSITLKSSDVQVSGSTLKSIGGRFNTVLENEAASSAVLVETATNTEIENVSFVSLGNKIDIAEPVALDENKDYKIVLKSGAKDIFGETLDADIEIAAFKTTINISADLLVAASDGTVIDVDNFDTITGITSASANDEIYAVCKIMNNYLEEVSALVAIAAYNEDNELVSVSFKLSNADAESTKVRKSDVIKVPTNAKTIKAFTWNSVENVPFGINVEFSVNN